MIKSNLFLLPGSLLFKTNHDFINIFWTLQIIVAYNKYKGVNVTSR